MPAPYIYSHPLFNNSPKMARGGKLDKIKSVLKKMQSFKLSRSNASSIAAAAIPSDEDDDSTSKDLHAVYVGNSRRRYLITSDVMESPLFRELVGRRGSVGNHESVTVACEVVLFEHLLWMLENADPRSESLGELVEFYAC
ncbi:auxin-responsive protein SAUR76-like [Primulina huaijiensis]|uniref:auxin-responsive protein SAUR76-like n=1 Tax=Primulina huaijiensis TaxID=1492673 RepID=UPI003CC76562